MGPAGFMPAMHWMIYAVSAKQFVVTGLLWQIKRGECFVLFATIAAASTTIGAGKSERGVFRSRSRNIQPDRLFPLLRNERGGIPW